MSAAAIRPFSTASYIRNTRMGETDCTCCLCGKPVLETETTSFVRVLADNSFAKLGQPKVEGEMGYYPLGPTCAAKAVKAGLDVTTDIGKA